jgi:MbtH protein
MTEDTMYKVVINDEDQFSMWPADQETPPGWSDTGKTGTQDECLEYIMTELQARGITTS